MDQANARESAIAEESRDLDSEKISAEEQLRESTVLVKQAVDSLVELEEQKASLESRRDELAPNCNVFVHRPKKIATRPEHYNPVRKSSLEQGVGGAEPRTHAVATCAVPKPRDRDSQATGNRTGATGRQQAANSKNSWNHVSTLNKSCPRRGSKVESVEEQVARARSNAHDVRPGGGIRSFGGQ